MAVPRSPGPQGRVEQGIAILAPCLYRKRAVDDAESNDSPELGRILRGFRVAYVWDESQTDGDALPDVRLQLLVGDDPAQLWAGLAAQLDDCGYTIGRGDCGGANGSTDFVARKVMVRDDIDDLQAVKTLCHETAHALLHDPCQEPVGRNRAEVEAESVAYVVCQRAGLATTDYSLPYVARWFGRGGRCRALDGRSRAGGRSADPPRPGLRRSGWRSCSGIVLYDVGARGFEDPEVGRVEPPDAEQRTQGP